MIILGLTGSVGMGKSTAALMLRRLGVAVHDSDGAVHRLLAPKGEAVAAVAAAFPGVRRADGGIDRAALGARVFADPTALRRLERILHPLVRRSQQHFLARARARRLRLVVLDVPLLFETGGAGRCDEVAVISAPAFLQRARVLARPGMTEARLRAVLAQQMPDAEKRRRADYVVPSGLGRAVTFRRLKRILRELQSAEPCLGASR
jgi:dephospho-CoA kinase